MIIHKQIIECYCHICKKRFYLDKIEVLDGQPFLKVDKRMLTRGGWVIIFYNGCEVYICEKHKDLTDGFLSKVEFEIAINNE
jgi:hypothetical protein